MNKRAIELVQQVSESLERRINETVHGVMEQHCELAAMNILINVGTSLLAKALVMTDPSNRDNVKNIAFTITQMKLQEGHAAVESMIAISKAMFPQGGSDTCQQHPPKKT
ncbi:MAG: hypothetical protein EBT78_11550 [Betaproteobacteria bacterium]|nr:hypothetical protein [Betaproteobacteria bacterium]NBT68382.1 hypothetical protein [Betaproteobacteria bacterium]